MTLFVIHSLKNIIGIIFDMATQQKGLGGYLTGNKRRRAILVAPYKERDALTVVSFLKLRETQYKPNMIEKGYIKYYGTLFNKQLVRYEGDWVDRYEKSVEEYETLSGGIKKSPSEKVRIFIMLPLPSGEGETVDWVSQYETIGSVKKFSSRAHDAFYIAGRSSFGGQQKSIEMEGDIEVEFESERGGVEFVSEHGAQMLNIDITAKENPHLWFYAVASMLMYESLE